MKLSLLTTCFTFCIFSFSFTHEKITFNKQEVKANSVFDNEAAIIINNDDSSDGLPSVTSRKELTSLNASVNSLAYLSEGVSSGLFVYTGELSRILILINASIYLL